MESRLQMKKRNLIFHGAKKVFALKGYAAVTMQDVADYCEISRANVYAYFHSTFDILNAIISEHARTEWSEFQRMEQEEKNAREILESYFAMHKKVFAKPDDYLVFATIEWYWQWGARDPAVGKQMFLSLLSFLQELIEYGVRRGDLAGGDNRIRAEQVAYLMFGIRAVCPALRPSGQEIERQFDLCRTLLYHREDIPLRESVPYDPAPEREKRFLPRI